LRSARGLALGALSALLALAPLACGGPGESSATTQPTRAQGGGEAAGSQALPLAPLRVPGGGSAQFRVKGGDNSVQEFGAEAGEAELREAAEAVHAFYVARVASEWSRACALLSEAQIESLEKFAAESPEVHGTGCPAALAALTKQASPSLARQLTTVDAAALRRESEQAFLIYTGPPGKTVYAMPLRREVGAWKLSALNGAVLPGT
jgi:hypothetical protein